MNVTSWKQTAMDDVTYASTSPSSNHDDNSGRGSVVNIENLGAIMDSRAKTMAPSSDKQMDNDDSSYETVEIIEEPSEYETIQEEIVYSDYVTDSESEMETNEALLKSPKDYLPMTKPTKSRAKKTSNGPNSQDSTSKSPPGSPQTKPKSTPKKTNKKEGPQGAGEEPEDDPGYQAEEENDNDEDGDDGEMGDDMSVATAPKSPTKNGKDKADSPPPSPSNNEKPVVKYTWKMEDFYHGKDNDCFNAWKQYRDKDYVEKVEKEKKLKRIERREIVTRRIKIKDRRIRYIRRRKEKPPALPSPPMALPLSEPAPTPSDNSKQNAPSQEENSVSTEAPESPIKTPAAKSPVKSVVPSPPKSPVKSPAKSPRRSSVSAKSPRKSPTKTPNRKQTASKDSSTDSKAQIKDFPSAPPVWSVSEEPEVAKEVEPESLAPVPVATPTPLPTPRPLADVKPDTQTNTPPANVMTPSLLGQSEKIQIPSATIGSPRVRHSKQMEKISSPKGKSTKAPKSPVRKPVVPPENIQTASTSDVYVALFISDCNAEPTLQEYNKLAKVTKIFYTRVLRKKYGETLVSVDVSVRQTAFESNKPSDKYNVYVEWDVQAHFADDSILSINAPNPANATHGAIPENFDLCRYLVDSLSMDYLEMICMLKSTSFGRAKAMFMEQVVRKECIDFERKHPASGRRRSSLAW